MRTLCAAYIESIRGTPLLIQLFLIFYGLPHIGIRLSPMLAAILGLAVGLPAALGYGMWSATHVSLEENVLLPAWVLVLQFFGPALSVFYAVAFLRHAPDFVVHWLAPAGRMPLTNYLLQSVAMGVLLSGWVLALGIYASYAEVSALALVVFALQVVFSRWWLARHAQGPLEAAWRAWTYHGLRRATAT